MRVAAVKSEALALDEIDVRTSIIKAIRKRVLLARGSLGTLYVILLYARSELSQVGHAISAADVRSEGDRRLLLEVAKDLQRFADTMSSCHSRWSLFKVVVVRLVDALVKAEDVAETAAAHLSRKHLGLQQGQHGGAPDLTVWWCVPIATQRTA